MRKKEIFYFLWIWACFIFSPFSSVWNNFFMLLKSISIFEQLTICCLLRITNVANLFTIFLLIKNQVSPEFYQSNKVFYAMRAYQLSLCRTRSSSIARRPITCTTTFPPSSHSTNKICWAPFSRLPQYLTSTRLERLFLCSLPFFSRLEWALE